MSPLPCGACVPVRPLKVYPACLLWGIGTAIGEIPPYALSRAAAEVRIKKKVTDVYQIRYEVPIGSTNQNQNLEEF